MKNGLIYETKTLTDKGYVQIGENVGKTFKVWNGEEFTETVFRKTGESQELMRIGFNDGSFLDCTREQLFLIKDVFRSNSTSIYLKKVEAKNLRITDKLCKKALPVIDGSIKELTEEQAKNDYFVPMGDYSIKVKVDFLNRIAPKMKNIKISGGYFGLNLYNIDEEYLNKVRLLIHTLGGTSVIRSNKKGTCLAIQSLTLFKLESLGFKLPDELGEVKRTKFTNIQFGYDKVKSIENLTGLHDTYCFTEYKRNLGVFNGYLMGA